MTLPECLSVRRIPGGLGIAESSDPQAVTYLRADLYEKGYLTLEELGSQFRRYAKKRFGKLIYAATYYAVTPGYITAVVKGRRPPNGQMLFDLGYKLRKVAIPAGRRE